MVAAGFSLQESILAGGRRAIFRTDMQKLPRLVGSSGASQFEASGEWLAASVDKRFFTASRICRVKAARATVTVAGTDASAVTAVIKKVPSGTAIGSGTAIHTGSINLKGTADTVQALTLSATAADLILAVGDSLALDFTGALDAATGVATVELYAYEANDDWILSGTNAADAGVSFLGRGGWQLSTAGADNDQMVLVAHTDTGRSAFAGVSQWRPDYRPRMEITIQALDIENVRLAAGFKLLPGTMDGTTDANQAMFFFDADNSDTSWRTVYSYAGTDVDTAQTDFALADDRWYHLVVEFTPAGKAVFKIGRGVAGQEGLHTVYEGATAILSSVTTLVPFVGIQAVTGSAKSVGIGEIVCGIDRW